MAATCPDMSKNIPMVDETTFEQEVLRSPLPVLLDFGAAWCGPCRVMGPQFEAAARAAEPAMRFVKLNSDENQDLAGRLGIRGIPTMILFRSGKEVARVSGAMSSADILNWAQSAAR